MVNVSTFNPPVRPIPNVSQPMQGYPLTLKFAYNDTPGASAVTKDFELAQKPIAAIVINMDMLGAAAAATVANALTQLATIIKVTDGGEDITPAWSAAELYEYNAAFRGSLPPFQDGTATDNKLALLSMVIPFGRPLVTRHGGLFSLYDPLVGFVPKGIPQLHMEIPADGNSIDTRHLKIGVLYYRDGTKPAYTKKWTNWASQTLSTTGGKDWILPSTGQLLEAFMFRNSSYNDTLTSDAPTLLRWNLTKGGKSVITDGEMFDIFSTMIDTTAQPDDDYCLLPFVQNTAMDLSLAPALGVDSRFTAFGGVADALTAAFSVIHPT